MIKSRMNRRLALLAALVAAITLAGCSPEYTRVRGGGQGADPGNRVLGPSMDIHGPVNPSFGEPLRGMAIERSQ